MKKGRSDYLWWHACDSPSRSGSFGPVSQKILGVKVDVEFNFGSQINAVVKSNFFQLRQLANMKLVLRRRHFETVVQAFITSRLDYCNAP